MRPKFNHVFLVFILAGVSGCGGQKGAKLQTSVVPPDKTLFQNGNEYLDKSQFIKARLAYQTLIRTYPGSELESEAYLAMGDSFYREGGTENLLMAEDQYRNFIIFFPTHPKTVDAQMKIIAIIMKQMHDPDRDQSFTKRAEAEIRKMITLFPNSDYIPIVKGYLDDVQDILARQNLGVGDFYAGRGNYFGAASRYKEIEDLYPHFARMDEVYFKYAQSMQKTENTDEAAKYLTRVASEYPFSKYFELAKAELQKMGKAVPAVNTQLAEQHQSLVKAPEPFSPLKPLLLFAEAIGFKGPPDRYEEARKIIAANKAEAAAAAEALKAGQTGGKPGEILITGTIERGPDGKPVAGSNAKGTPPATDKKDDKKQDNKTTTTTKKK
jgi:outer membrane assembly lipoprotein YfiO